MKLEGKDIGVCGVISLYGSSDLEALYYHTNQHLHVNHSAVCIDSMYFDKKGFVQRVKITNEAVGKQN